MEKDGDGEGGARVSFTLFPLPLLLRFSTAREKVSVCVVCVATSFLDLG